MMFSYKIIESKTPLNFITLKKAEGKVHLAFADQSSREYLGRAAIEQIEVLQEKEKGKKKEVKFRVRFIDGEFFVIETAKSNYEDFVYIKDLTLREGDKPILSEKTAKENEPDRIIMSLVMIFIAGLIIYSFIGIKNSISEGWEKAKIESAEQEKIRAEEKKLEIANEKKRKEDEEKNKTPWKTTVWKDEMDDGIGTSIGTRAYNPDTDRNTSQELFIACINGKTKVGVELEIPTALEYNNPHKATVRLKFDKAKPVTQKWGITESGTIILTPDPMGLIKKLQSADSVLFEFNAFGMGNTILRFDVQKLYKELPAIAALCKWKT